MVSTMYTWPFVSRFVLLFLTVGFLFSCTDTPVKPVGESGSERDAATYLEQTSTDETKEQNVPESFPEEEPLPEWMPSEPPQEPSPENPFEQVREWSKEDSPERPVQEQVPEQVPDGPSVPVCTEQQPSYISCSDYIEQGITTNWKAFAQDNAPSSVKSVASVFFGKFALRVETQAAFTFHVRYTSSKDLDLSGYDEIFFVLRASNTNAHNWQGNFPLIRLIDHQGNKISLTPSRQWMPIDGKTWKKIRIPLKGGGGWTRKALGATFTMTKVQGIEVAMDTWGKGFWFELDGLTFLKKGQMCQIQCPNKCSNRGRCVQSEMRCACELGAVGTDCSKCAQGFQLSNGHCELQKKGQYDTWPNPVSKTNGDAWLLANHKRIKMLRPKVLALHFVNVSTPIKSQQLLQKIFAGFKEGSRHHGYMDTSAKPQLELQLAKLADLRDGHNGNPAKPSGWPFRNSTLYPRKKVNGKWILDYSKFFAQSFAKHYGYRDPNNKNRYLTLCELVEKGEIHEVWMIGAHTDKDAPAAEVLEYKQRYTPEGNPIPGSFDPCGGNGCFAKDVPHCKRSVKIGFVNFERGPGCYLHSIGHGIEWSGTRDIVPSLQAWFQRFGGFDLDKRYGLPFNSLYAVSCPKEPCVSYNGKQATISHRGQKYQVKDWNPFCGNVHFPPNGIKHYDYKNAGSMLASCVAFGRPTKESVKKNRCDVYPEGKTSRQSWQKYEQLSPDCGGGFLVWWFQNMPGFESRQYFPNGQPMLSIWPFLYY